MTFDIFVTITGQKQGPFKGQSQDKAFQGKGWGVLQQLVLI